MAALTSRRIHEIGESVAGAEDHVRVRRALGDAGNSIGIEEMMAAGDQPDD